MSGEVSSSSIYTYTYIYTYTWGMSQRDGGRRDGAEERERVGLGGEGGGRRGNDRRHRRGWKMISNVRLFCRLCECAEAVVADNSRVGLRGRLCGQVRGWGSNLSYSWHPKCCHTHMQTHTRACTRTSIGGIFPALAAAIDLGEFSLGCANFSLRGQGGRWCLCAGGVTMRNRRKTKDWRTKYILYCCDQTAGDGLKKKKNN